jgi:serine/threonine protein kinase
VDKAGELNDDESMATELALLKGLQHPNLCGLYETFDSPTTLWLIMELVGGGDLRHAVSETEHFSESFVLNVARQVSAGLHYMHSSGVVHRDIKPENVMRVSTAPDSMVPPPTTSLQTRTHQPIILSTDQSTESQTVHPISACVVVQLYILPTRCP